MAEQTIIDLANENIDATPDPELLEKGTEVEVRITGTTSGQDKNGHNFIMFFYDVPDQPNVKEINEFVGLPSTQREERDNMKSRQKLKAIGRCFDIDWSTQISLEELKGRRGWVIVGKKKNEPENTIDQYLGAK